MPEVLKPPALFWAAIVSILLLSGHAVREVENLFSGDVSSAQREEGLSGGLITNAGAANSRHQALPPVQSSPASAGLGSWRANTAELPQTPSVRYGANDELAG
ncbi:MAG: hypothetical protein M3384_20750 [Acidobacteriota bacterium]|nr:hypothetical protein [Acidobacteriota bacterium]